MDLSALPKQLVPVLLLSTISYGAWRYSTTQDIDEASAAPVAYEAELTTPLLSGRRVPQTLQAPIAAAAVQPSIEALLQGSTPDTCLVLTDGDRVLGEQNPSLSLVPASNQKLLTTYAATRILGADAFFTTRVMSSSAINGGVLDGDLYLVGGGDPFLSTDDWRSQYTDPLGRFDTRLESLADDVAASGIIEVTGNLVGDESYLDTQRQGPWAERLVTQNQSGPLSALSVNEGFVGWPEVYAGSFRLREKAIDPAANAAAVFGRLLAERGITISGDFVTGSTPAVASQVASISSPPLSDLIIHINSFSNNYGAELLTKHIGLETRRMATTAAGAGAIFDQLAADGFNVEGVQIDDGSGLAESGRLTCVLLAELLARTGPDSDLGQSLSVGGERGSLDARFEGTTADGFLLAKTGTLNGVTALSGFVNSPREPDTTLTFAYIVNGELAGTLEGITSLQQPFVEALARYPDAPLISQLDPLEESLG